MCGYIRILIIYCFPILLFGQGYYNQENFGNRSMLLSGNVTGSVDDLGLTYYNPARIALVENPVFSINAKAYQFSSIRLKNIFGAEDKLNDSRFEGIPSLVSGTFNIEKWENHHFAYSFLSKQRSRFNINFSRDIESGQIIDEIAEVERFVGDFKLDNKENDEWFGVTWGTKLKDNFSIGVSTFVSVYNFSGSYDLRFATLDQLNDVNLYNNEIKFGENSYGIFWKIGLAWKLKKIDFGINLDLPYLELISNGKFRYQRFLSGTENGEDEFRYYDFKDIDSKRKEPMGISVGAGIPWGKNKFHFKADWHGKLSEYSRLVIPTADDGTEGFAFKEELRSVINFGLGVEFYVNEDINLYGSFSTDFSPIKTSANIFDLLGGEQREANFDANYFHYGFGMNFKLKKMQLILGTTYSSASGDFIDPLEFPDPDFEVPINGNPSNIKVTRWRFIIGLEIPIFGYELEFK